MERQSIGIMALTLPPATYGVIPKSSMGRRARHNDSGSPNVTHPANWGEQIGTLGHFNMTWDVSLTGNLNQYDVLAETFLSGHEFGIILNSPDYLTDWAKWSHTISF